MLIETPPQRRGTCPHGKLRRLMCRPACSRHRQSCLSPALITVRLLHCSWQPGVFDHLCSGCSGKDLSVCPSLLPPRTTPPLLLLKARAEGFPPWPQQIPVCSSLLCVYLAELGLVLHKLLILTGSLLEEQRCAALLCLGKQNNLFLIYGIQETSTCSPQYFLINTTRLS